MKLDGTYRVPAFGGFNLSAVYRYTTGLAYGRTATIRGLTQGSETVRVATRGTFPAPTRSTTSISASKTFPIGSSSRQAGVTWISST